VPRANEAAVPLQTLDQAPAHIKAGYYVLGATELQQIGAAKPPNLDRAKSLAAVAAVVAKFPAAHSLFTDYGAMSLDDPAIDAATREVLLFAIGMNEVMATRYDRDAHEPPPDTTGKLRQIRPGSPYWARASLAIAKDANLRGAPEGVLEPVRELAKDRTYALEALRLLVSWRLNQRAYVDPRDLPFDTTGEAYNTHLARTVTELEKIGKTDSVAADSARFHVELVRLGREIMFMKNLPPVAFEQAVIATVCTKGSTNDVVPAVATTIRETRAFVDRAVPEDDGEIETKLLATRELAATNAGAAAVWLAIGDTELADLRAWHAQAARELQMVTAAKLGERELQDITIAESIWASEVGRAYRSRIDELLRELRWAEELLGKANSELRVTGKGRLKVAAGTAGLEVALSSCPGEQASRTMSRPDAPATRAHGCAGCATSGSSSGWLVLALLVLRRRRRV